MQRDSSPISGNTRRKFLAQVGVGVAGVAGSGAAAAPANDAATPIDFRYAPLDAQTAFCFPDDPYKSLVASSGELRYGHPGTNTGIDAFSAVVHFSVAGMEPDRVVRQELESPGVPIVHTFIERPAIELELITFASNRPEEGRVDNVILQIRNRGNKEVHAAALVRVDIVGRMEAVPIGGGARTRVIGTEGDCFLLADTPLAAFPAPSAWVFAARAVACWPGALTRLMFRFPQQRQPAERMLKGLGEPDALLAETRQYWSKWKAFGGEVKWSLPGRYQEFLMASARNILQAREVKEGRKTFQVGPTCYRGLWIVDGNFILEAARYMGYDADAQQGLEATWAHQLPSGGVFASAPGEHWKDTAIAMFTLVRQGELSGDWSYFRAMVPNLLRAAESLREVRDRARTENSANGRYGLLGRGFGDGGLGGLRSELANTVWVLAGLRATVEAAGRLGLATQFAPVRRFHEELRSAFFAAAPHEMRRHPSGFDYLPMLMKEDSAWEAVDTWSRPRPQVAQWALSHAIYPGLVFEKDDPVVRGHIALMQASTQEDVPAETGWLAHDSLWTYNAPFASHVYLWAGESALASRCFAGFLNHASPLYCWREEQPLRGSLVSGYWGDMPHNWASAECILYLRHMLALEDGRKLRLLAGLDGAGLNAGDEVVLEQTPTRFGRLNLRLTPSRKGWRLECALASGSSPERIELPEIISGSASLKSVDGAKFERRGGVVRIDPASKVFSAEWSTR